MADDKDLEIRATLDAAKAERDGKKLGETVETALDKAAASAEKAGEAIADAGRAASDAGSSAGGAMEGLATAAQKAGDSGAEAGRKTAEALRDAAGSAGELQTKLSDVGREAQISARQIVSVASHLASMGIAAYNAVNPGAMSKPVSGALQMGLQGAGMGAMFGPWGAALGGLGGAALGWWGGRKQDEREAGEAAAARAETIGASEKALANMQWEQEKAAYLKSVFQDLADTSKSVEEREAKRGEAVGALEDAQRRLMSWMQSEDVKADPAKMNDYLRRYASNAAALDRLRDAQVREAPEEKAPKEKAADKSEAFERRTQAEVTALEKLGINIGAAQNSRTVESIDQTVKEVLKELKLIPKEEDVTVWQ